MVLVGAMGLIGWLVAVMKNKPIFQFSNVVVVDGENIGVIVKTWDIGPCYSYDVYVRYHSVVKNYHEFDIKHFVYSKELSEDEQEFYK